jgi:hypothetical protein
MAIAFIGLIAAATLAPKEIDWSLSFSKRHGIPLGGKLVFDVLPSMFPAQNITTAHSPLTQFLGDDTPLNTNFIYINTAYSPEIDEVNKLIEVVEAGNSVFIAAQHFSHKFIDTARLAVSYNSIIDQSITVDSVRFSLTNRKLETATGYWFKKAFTDNHITAYDSTRTTVLGYNNKGQTNFIRMKFGKGWLYIHCNPMIFTNYHLLAGNHSEYIFKCLSYMPVAPTVWDENYKEVNVRVASPIGYILNNRALRIAWYIMLLGVVLYFVFEGKRRQRPIPVIQPPGNNSLEFVETVSRLYFSRQEHKGIAQKRFIYFIDFIRKRYFIDFNTDEERLIDDVSQKSGIPHRSVRSLIGIGKNIEKVNSITHEDLLQFNSQLEYFYKNCR